jgi:hypothetical protein
MVQTVPGGGGDRLRRWITNGANEGRDPSELFSTHFYRRRTIDDPDLPANENSLDYCLALSIAQGVGRFQLRCVSLPRDGLHSGCPGRCNQGPGTERSGSRDIDNRH